MRNKIIQTLESEFAQAGNKIPAFQAGDTVLVQIKVKEGNRVRLQPFEGVVIAKRNRGYNSAFTVRKISSGVGVERVFQSHSPLIDSVTVKRYGDVRRAKLYYMRELRGRAARIKEKLNVNKKGSEAAPTKAKAEAKTEAPTSSKTEDNNSKSE